MSETADGFFVSTLSGMCEHHAEDALRLIAQVLDGPGVLTAGEQIAEMRRYLAEERLSCIENCGRAS